MGLRIGAASRIPVNTTTNAASNSTTRKKEGWRSAVVMVSPIPDLPSWGLSEASLMTLSLSVSPGSVAKLGAQSYQRVLRGYLLLTQMSSHLGTQSSVA